MRVNTGVTVADVLFGHRLQRWGHRSVEWEQSMGDGHNVLFGGCRLDRWGSQICWVGVTVGVTATDVLCRVQG